MNRSEISHLILSKLKDMNLGYLKEKYKESSSINYCIIDNLLPTQLALDLNNAFPKEKDLNPQIGLQEKKYVGVEFTNSQKIVEECIYAFQERSVIEAIGFITDIKNIIGDPELYAGGISSMSEGCFLNPHIDNSHDRNLSKFRRLNLLYYVNKNWSPEKDGGELILYPNGIKKDEIKLSCRFNRLVIMRTDNKSLHGVNKIKSKKERRKCISNYYFSEESPLGNEYYHSTSFRGFKRQYLKGALLRVNGISRTIAKKLIYKLTKKSISTNYHKKIE